ncbi:MAG: hypothetical protein K6L75_10135 [Cellvibrionaceae bacterium]
MTRILFFQFFLVSSLFFFHGLAWAQENLEIKESGEFTQKKIIKVLPSPLVSRGSFQFSKTKSIPNLIWKTIAPISSVLYFDEFGVRQSVEGEVTWSVAADQPVVTTLTKVIAAVLVSDWETLENYFDIKMIDPETKKQEVDSIGVIDSTVVKLISRDAGLKSAILSMTIVLSESDDKSSDAKTVKQSFDVGGDIEQLIMYEANGDRTEITFSFLGDSITNE